MSALPVVSGLDLVKYLKKKGFIPHHQTGSHLILKKSNGREVTLSVPLHAELRKGTLMAILGEAGITRDEFVEEYWKETLAAQPINAQEMDFVVVSEDYSRYLVIKDGTILKAKIVVKKILRVGDITPQGYPQGIGLDSVNVATSIVPPAARGPASNELFDITREVGEEVKFEPIEEKTQEYVTNDGYKITVRPVVTKIFKYKKFNALGEPIYYASIQAITNIERFATTATNRGASLPSLSP